MMGDDKKLLECRTCGKPLRGQQGNIDPLALVAECQCNALTDGSPKTATQVMVKARMDADNWAHRSQGMRCRTCMWWVKKEYLPLPPRTEPATEGKPDPMFKQQLRLVGRCRRHAPTQADGWPAVFADDWCGDHKIDENKV